MISFAPLLNIVLLAILLIGLFRFLSTIMQYLNLKIKQLQHQFLDLNQILSDLKMIEKTITESSIKLKIQEIIDEIEKSK